MNRKKKDGREERPCKLAISFLNFFEDGRVRRRPAVVKWIFKVKGAVPPVVSKSILAAALVGCEGISGEFSETSKFVIDTVQALQGIIPGVGLF